MEEAKASEASEYCFIESGDKISKDEIDEFWTNPKSSLIKEFRMILPLSLHEYEIGLLWQTIEEIKDKTDIHDRFQWPVNKDVIVNNAKTHYTERIIPLMPIQEKKGFFAKHMAPSGSLYLKEKSYDTFPSCRTRFYNSWLKDNFELVFDNQYESGMDMKHNVFGLSTDELAHREIINIDIVNDPFVPTECCLELPELKDLYSKKTGRGPYEGEFWINPNEPLICVYKLVRLSFKKWKMVQTHIENEIMKGIHKIIFHSHRKLLFNIDDWYDLKIDEIRQLEDQLRHDLSTGKIIEKPKQKLKTFYDDNDEGESEVKNSIVYNKEGKNYEHRNTSEVTQIFDTVISTIDTYDYVLIQ